MREDESEGVSTLAPGLIEFDDLINDLDGCVSSSLGLADSIRVATCKQQVSE